MGFMLVATAAAALLTNSVSAQGGYYAPPAASNLTNSGTSLTLLYQNNLNASDDVNHISAILLDSMTLTAGAAACAAIGESLLTEAAIKNYTSDFYHELSYLEFSGQAGPNQHFFIQNGVVAVGRGANNLNFPALPYGTPGSRYCARSPATRTRLTALSPPPATRSRLLLARTISSASGT